MADLNRSLRDYLSKSSTSHSSGDLSPTKTTLLSNLPGVGWLNKSNTEEPLAANSTNGWFSQAQNDPLLPSLSRKQRILGFFTCLLLGTFCFSIASLYIPLLVIKARKFAVLYTLGSLFVIFSFSFLWGPVNHMKHLFSMGRLPFTTAYFGSLLATVYFSMWVKSTLFTVFFAVVQIITLVWYIVSYIPGGQTGLKFFSKICYGVASKTVSSTLPM
ncbi:protein transport protein sft2-like [Gigantopelta aegis]|uniref:protein transport protein sft2-like n=1 Tax=Gigantopelta aegis TaxID=1735272 RepID=UPI001B8883B3|nr:protein transport protein sft2-like [Gigantopelta aegis]